jgi:hypothetical protein
MNMNYVRLSQSVKVSLSLSVCMDFVFGLARHNKPEVRHVQGGSQGVKRAECEQLILMGK